MISIPLKPIPPDNTPEAVFGDDFDPLFIYRWNPGTGTYVLNPSPVDPGHGYWVYIGTAGVTIDVTGTRIDSNYEVPLGPKGWHMISTPRINVYWGYCRFRLGEEELDFNDAVSRKWIVPYIWKWNPTANAYERYMGDGVIEPWVGYWILTKEDNLILILPVYDAIHNPPAHPPEPLALLEPTGQLDLTPPSPPSLAALAKDYLTVLAYPNPATASTVTFRALGLPVEAIRVSVFDLGGRKVWAGEAVGHELAWNLADSTGRPLANGVYLYVVEVRLSGEWVSMGLQRLLILR